MEIIHSAPEWKESSVVLWAPTARAFHAASLSTAGAADIAGVEGLPEGRVHEPTVRKGPPSRMGAGRVGGLGHEEMLRVDLKLPAPSVDVVQVGGGHLARISN